MNILLVSGAFYPDNSPRSFRTTELAKEFVRKGHIVTVIIPQNSYDYHEFLKNYPITIKFYQFPKGKRIFTRISIVDRIIFRLLNQFYAYPNIKLRKPLRKMIKEEHGYDLLITIAVPHMIHWEFGKLYAKGKRVANNWVADCGDSFMLNKSINYKQPFYFRHLEKTWCRYCDYIAVPLESERENYYQEFSDKVRVIPQGFDFSVLDNTHKEPHNDVPTFAFSGSFIPNLRDPRPILDYLVSTNKDFRFIVYTKQKELLAPYIDRLGSKLEIREFIPRDELLKVLSQCDFLLNIDNGKAKGRPSKLIDYALSGRPILSLNSSNVDKNLIDEFLSGDYSRKYEIGDVEQFNIKNVAQQFLDLCR